MIDGPITFLIQNPGDAALRYTGCDCLANMTAEIFEQLTVLFWKVSGSVFQLNNLNILFLYIP